MLYDIIEEDVLRKLYIDDKLPGTKIAKQFNVSNSWIYQLLNQYGIPIRSRSEASKLSSDDGKATKLERYGDPNYNNQDKHKATCLDRYNCEHHNQRLEAREHLSEMKKSQEVQAKFEASCLANFGYKNPSSSPEVQEKMHRTKKANNSYGNKSKPADDFYENLLSIYSEDDIEREYKEDRYPFSCDFYIKSKDLFIEINYHYTHGFHPFNREDLADLNKIVDCIQSNKSVDTWVRRDPLKVKTAKENNIHMYILYPSMTFEIKDGYMKEVNLLEINDF